MGESRVRKAFKQALRRARLPDFRLYDLRHTYASLLLAASAPICSTARRGSSRRRWAVWFQIWNQSGNRNAKRAVPVSGSGRLRWWAVKDSNLGPADQE
jgi:integrase